MNSQWEVLVASSDLENCQSLAGVLSRHGIETICASTVSQLDRLLKGRMIRLVFCDHDLPDGDYRDILAVVNCQVARRPKVVVMCADMSATEYEDARHLGLFDVITKPSRPPHIEWMVIMARRAELLESSQVEFLGLKSSDLRRPLESSLP